SQKFWSGISPARSPRAYILRSGCEAEGNRSFPRYLAWEPRHTRNLRQPKTWPESFCLGEDRQPAIPSLAARKVDFTQGRLPP
ncbi:hypothetical protein ACSLOG_27585, partial [Escherichia coli]|uniref:hypothetical protein n=1 Tax=Escherichia coli TaxID=562 RepID=UPI003EDEF70C